MEVRGEGVATLRHVMLAHNRGEGLVTEGCASLHLERSVVQVRNGCFNEAPCAPFPSLCQCSGPTTVRH
eukprot:COSAG01_NODE_1494_length_10125_cov_93.590805_10_plen_69_part_00